MSQSNTNGTQRKPQAPMKSLRVGSLRCAIWANQAQRDGRNVTDYTIRINRRYKDRNDQWQTTDSLFPENLLAAAFLAQKAFEFIALNTSEAEPQDARE